MILGVDFSQWGGELRPATLACWKENGVRHAVVQYSHLMQQHINALHIAGGIIVEAYVYLYWNNVAMGTPQERTYRALQSAGNGISFLWLDAEDTSAPFNLKAEQDLLECVDICNRAGMPCGIYTGRWWWVSHGRNVNTFSHLPLWDAHYVTQGATPDWPLMPQSMEGFRPYGGWDSARIWQWQDTTNFCGHSVDLNVLELVDRPPIPEPIEGEDYDMKSHHAWSTWFETEESGIPGRIIAPSEFLYTVQAKSDFSLPDDALAVLCDVEYYEGEAEFYHGNSEIPATNMGRNSFIANLVEGTMLFRSLGGCRFKRLHCTGYFK